MTVLLRNLPLALLGRLAQMALQARKLLVELLHELAMIGNRM